MALLSQSAALKSEEKKKNLQKKTLLVSSVTLTSRLFGLAREYLLIQFLGVGAISDAFITANKIPNFFRKIFAEGALSPVFVPTVIDMVKKKGSQEHVNRLMTLSFLFFEGIVILICLLIAWQAPFLIYCIAPGWFPSTGPLEQVGYAVSCLRILIGTVVFFSSNALLAGALQAVNHFFIPAVCPVILNIVIITGIITCLTFNLAIPTISYFFLVGGVIQFLLHLTMYLRLNFSFKAFTRETLPYFYQILLKFLPCIASKSILELNLFISTSLATYLSSGSISLLSFTNRFMGIPLGVFAEAFSTTLLPHFSHVSTYAPKRLSFYLFEAAKLIFWVTVPLTLIMSFLAEKFFMTLFLSHKFSSTQAQQAGILLTIFLTGLFFFSLNKILLNIFYSMHKTFALIIISCAVLVTNFSLCQLFISLGTPGLALSFVLSSIVQTIICTIMLVQQFHLILFIRHFMYFTLQALIQIATFFALFLCGYKLGSFIIEYYLSSFWAHFFLHQVGFWLWVAPLIGIMALFMIKSRKYFKIHLYFLD